MEVIPWDGKPISRPGFYAGVGMDAYHGQAICVGPSVSSSNLRRVLEINGGSPAHMHAEWSGNPNAIESEDTKAMIFGRAVHHLMLGEPDFHAHFIIRPTELPHYKTGELRKWHGNNIEVREWLDAAAISGLTVLTEEDLVNIKGMSDRLSMDPLVRTGLLRGHIECSGFWRDDETGLWIKIRPDAIPTDSGDYSDLKTTISVQVRDLTSTVGAYAYHQQAALVAEGARICVGLELTSFSFVFVEKKNPWCCSVVMVDPNDIELGQRQNHSAMRLIRRCIDAGDWPGPNEGHVVKIGLSDRYREIANKFLTQEQQAT